MVTNELKVEKIKFDSQGLVPAIIQDAVTKEILMLAYMNQESLQKTLETNETWFWSRSRQELWHKGATSGNTQKVVAINTDCDSDTLLILVVPKGPACHTGTYSCFDGVTSEIMGEVPFEIIYKLEKVIAQRQRELPADSYTTYLFTKGLDKILKKVGEEATEVVIAAKNEGKDELTYELADLVFHCMVLMRERDIAVNDIIRELERRVQK